MPSETSAQPGPESAAPGLEFVAANGKRLRLVCGVEEVLGADGVAVGVRINPTVVDQQRGRVLSTRTLAKLDAPDFWEIDSAVLSAARPFLERPERPVIVPISFHSVSRNRARKRLFEAAGMSPEGRYPAMVAEVVASDPGTPHGRLADAVAVLRPLASAVFIEVLNPTHVKQVIVHPVAGLSLDVRGGRGGDEALLRKLRDFSSAAGGRVRTLLARGLPSDVWAPRATEAGITHFIVRRQAAVEGAGAAA